MNEQLAKALGLLPHGPEFRFVQRLLKLEPGLEGIGEYCVTGKEPFLQGHFPGQPLFPGVLLVEAAAQLAGIVAQSDPRTTPLPGLKLAGIRNLKLFGTAEPGQVIQLEARITGRLGLLVQADTLASVNARIIMKGALSLSGEASGK